MSDLREVVDELTYRCYRWNREQYGLKPESCFQVWGERIVEAMEARFRKEKANG